MFFIDIKQIFLSMFHEFFKKRIFFKNTCFDIKSLNMFSYLFGWILNIIIIVYFVIYYFTWRIWPYLFKNKHLFFLQIWILHFYYWKFIKTILRILSRSQFVDWWIFVIFIKVKTCYWCWLFYRRIWVLIFLYFLTWTIFYIKFFSNTQTLFFLRKNKLIRLKFRRHNLNEIIKLDDFYFLVWLSWGFLAL